MVLPRAEIMSALLEMIRVGDFNESPYVEQCSESSDLLFPARERVKNRSENYFIW